MDTEITNRRLDLGMPQKYLHSAEVTRSLVHKCRLGSTQRVRSIVLPRQADLGNPFRDQPRVLPSAKVADRIDPTWKGEIIYATAASLELKQQARSSWLEQLELHGPSCLLLDYSGIVADLSTADQIANSDRDHVTAAQLAIDREVERRTVAHPAFVFEKETDCPDILRL